MKVIGQLERAQLEQSTPGTLPGPASTGRVYADVTTPTAAIPRFYTGSQWVPFLMGQNTPLVSQTSTAGSTVVVNWANGLNQQVILGGHTTIQFQNPQAGQIHTLAITQRETNPAGTTPWMYCFNFPDQETRRQPYSKKGVLQSGETQVYSWFYSSGIKPAYVTIPGAYGNPQTLPTGATFQIDVSPDGQYLYTCQAASPYGDLYPLVDAGSKFIWGPYINLLQNPSAASSSVSVSPDNSSAFWGTGTTPYLAGRTLQAGNAFGAFTAPSTLPAGAVNCVAVHPSGSHVAAGCAASPYLIGYSILSGAYGATRLVPATTGPAAQVNALAWSPTGDFIAVASSTTPFLQVYTFDPFAGFGANPISNPATLPAGGPVNGCGKAVAWHPSGNWIAMGMNTTPYIYIVAFNRSTGAFGSVISVSLISGPASAVNCLQFSPDGNYLFVGNSANLFVYDTSALPTFGPSAVSYDSSGPASQVNDIVFHPNGELYFLALQASPYIWAGGMPRKQKNYLKINY